MRKLMDFGYSFVDYSDYEEDHSEDLDGVTPKIVLRTCDGNKILKFAKVKGNQIREDFISEFIACRIAKRLDYEVQEVELATFNGKKCVAVNKFDYDIITFYGFGSSTDSEKVDYDLDVLLSLPFNQDKFSMSQTEFERYVWKVFVLDMYLSNFDRHENNWGFCKKDGIYSPAGLYDFGGSLYSKYVIDCPKITEKEMEYLIQYDSRCAIYYGGKKKNYFELLSVYHDNEILRDELWNLLQKLSNVNFEDIFSETVSFDAKYLNYTVFAKDMLKKKEALLRRFYGSS